MEATMQRASGPTHFDPDIVYNFELSEIFADEEFNCRGIIDPTSVIELANDIKHKGLTEPIIVQPWSDRPDKRFRIIAGYRRYKAHQINQAKTIRTLVREGLTDLDARLLNLSENLHREDLNIKQEAHAIDHFRRAGWTEMEVADKIRKSRGWVQVRFMLLELPDDIQDEAAANLFSQQQIRDLAGLPSVEQMYEFVRLVKEKKYRGKKREVKPADVKVQNERKLRGQEEIEAMQDTIREAMGKNGLATKSLGWAAGYISDLDLHKAIYEDARLQGRYYAIPDGLEGLKANQVRPLKNEALKGGA